MANVKFERGLEDDVTTEIPTDGHLYVGTDTGNMYLGKNDGTKLPIGQSDWNQTDNTKSDFIKNKPDIPKERVYIAGDNVEITALTDLYTPVEYIENDALTYINTGITPQADGFEMELVARLVSGYLYIFQHRQTSSANILGFYRSNTSTGAMRLYPGTSSYVATALPTNKTDVFRFVGSVNDGKARIYAKNMTTGEDDTKEMTLEETPTVGTRYFGLFGNRIGTTASTTSPAGTRIYKARMVQSGVLVMDFIPVVRKSDGRAGFYDLVTGGFFTDDINEVSVLSGGPALTDREYHIVSVPDIPTDTSDLTNGAGFITNADLPAPYMAGNGIAINSNNEISAKVSEGNGLGFGANGDIALSLVQNSANGAMASDDFRKLYDNVEMVQILGTEYPLNNWYINSNNNYVASTTYKSYLISVSSIGKVSFYDSATTTYYSFLKPYEEGGSSNVPNSTDYAYATGYTGRKSVSQGTTEVVSVPSDATWLWVYSGQNKAYDPTSLKFTGIAISGESTTLSLVGEHGISVTPDQSIDVTKLGLSSEWLYYAFWYKYTALYDLSGVNLPIDTGVINMSNSGFEFPKAGWYFVSVQILVDITRNNPLSMIHAELMWEVNKGTRHSITALSISVPNGGVVPLNMQGVFQLNEDPVSSFVISLKMEITDGSANIVIDAPTGGSWIEHSDKGSNIFIRRLNPYH